jgi:hypothetical protein
MSAYVEAGADEFNYVSDWKEQVGDEGTAQATFTLEAHSATLRGFIPWNMRRSALRFFLGYSYADIQSPYRLHRENPHQHPAYPWLRAYNVNFTPVRTKANTANANNSPYNVSPFDPFGYEANYEYALATVMYRPFRERFFDDFEISTNADEWQRNTILTFNPGVQSLSADGVSQLIFAESPGGAGEPTAGTTAFPAPVAELLNKCDLMVDWNALPWDYVSSDPDLFYPDKILACLGCVNTDMFLGLFEAGTVILNTVEHTPFLWPVASELTSYPLWGVHVRLGLQFFDPEKGVSGSSYRGHNLMPWRRNGKFYYATRDGTTGGRPLLRTTSFANIFKHVEE